MIGKQRALVCTLMLLLAASCTPDSRQAWKDGRLSHDLARMRNAEWWPWAGKTVIPPPPEAQEETEAPPDAMSEAASVPPPIPAPAPLLDVMPPAAAVLAAAQSNPIPGAKAPPRVKPPVKPRSKPLPKPAVKPAAIPAPPPIVEAPPASAPPASLFLNAQEVLAPLAAAKPAQDKAALPALALLAPKDLIGLDPAAIERLLGAPHLNRHEPFAQVWQYSNSQCVLFVYLYTVKTGGQQVAHAETGARVAGQQPDPAACITSFARKSQPG